MISFVNKWFSPVVIVFSTLYGFLCVPVCFANEDEINAEVLIFVDVSGSMIKNDPGNIRASAIRLLAGMAPSDVRAGIFLFGTNVRKLVAPAKVDAAWKEKADAVSDSFRSRDMYTNIEAALLTANKNWTNNPNRNRSIILLTDGIVDIDKKKAVSEASRARIIQSVLAELKQENIKVHTIALSENADHELLKNLPFRPMVKIIQSPMQRACSEHL